MNLRILNKQIIALSAAFCVTGAGITFGILRMRQTERGNTEKLLALRVQYDTIQNNYTRLESDLAQTQRENTQLKDAMAAVTADRDNLLVQIKKGLADRSQLEELRAALEQSQKDMDVLTREKNEAAVLVQDLQKKIKENTAAREQSEMAYRQLSSEKEQVLDALEKLRQKTGVDAIMKEKEEMAKRLASLDAQVKSLRTQEQASQSGEKTLRSDLDEARAKLQEMTAKYSDAARKNKKLEKKLIDGPARFAEIARQNKVLMAETAAMHYNLGVFYSRQKEYGRALHEFLKAVELKPNDASSLFNIGYIYAEHLIDREKAVKAFQKYLQYAEKNDKDADWARKYVVTWQTWDTTEPIN